MARALHSFAQFLLFVEMANGYNGCVSRVGSVLSGKELKVSIGQYSVATIIFRNSSGDVIGYGGYMYEQLRWISIQLNFSVNIFAFNDDAIDFWSQMRSQILRKEIDIACASFLGLGFYYMLDLAVYVTGYPIGILTPYPMPQTSNYGHILIFSRDVWIGIFLSILACVGFIQLIVLLKRKYFKKENEHQTRGFATLSDISTYIFATLTNHGGYFQKSYQSVGIIASAWCLATFVFVNVYSTCLTSYMSLTFQRPGVNSFHDLMTNPKYQLTIVKADVAESLFMLAESGTWKNIADKIRQCPDDHCHTTNSDQAAHRDRVLDGKAVAILPVPFIEENMFQTFSKYHECRVTMAQETIAYRHYFMAVPKKSPFLSELLQSSYWWHAFGLQSYWTKKMLRSAPQCQLQYNSMGEAVQLVDKVRLKLEQFYVAFAILFAGYALSLIQFLRERFILFKK